jgi:hypothetical protein
MIRDVADAGRHQRNAPDHGDRALHADELAHHHGRDPYAYRQDLLRGNARA